MRAHGQVVNVVNFIPHYFNFIVKYMTDCSCTYTHTIVVMTIELMDIERYYARMTLTYVGENGEIKAEMTDRVAVERERERKRGIT